MSRNKPIKCNEKDDYLEHNNFLLISLMRSLINSLSLLTTANFSKLKELYVVAVLNIRPVAVFSCESVAYLLCSISTFSLLLKLQLVLLNS